MVGHKRVAKGVEHDESENWTQSRDEKCGGHLHAASHIPSRKIDYDTQHDPGDEPDVCQWIARRNRPLRIHERQLRWPN